MAAESSPARWRARLGSVRVRTTAAAVAVVGVALIVASVALVLALRQALTREARNAAEVRAGEAARALAAGTPPSEVAVDNESLIVLVLDEHGALLAAGDLGSRLPASRLPGPGRSAIVDVPFDDDDYLGVAQPVAGGTVVALRSLEGVADTTQTAAGLLAVGVPLLLLVVGATTWRLTGRALAPVDAMRAEADAVSVRALHRRVPQPAGADEIARLAATLNRMLDRLERAHIRQRQFVSDASHELRSPVAAIRQHAEVARAHPERVPVDQLATTVHAEALRLQRLVDDLLLLARLDEGDRSAGRPIDLDDIVFDEALRLRDTSALAVDTTAVSAGRIDADPLAARRLLRNLVDNAARHARATVALSLSEADGRVLLRVDDDGPGIQADDRARVFDRFVRLDGARVRDGDGGAGLGLAIVAEVVRAHGGTVSVGDAPLGGARIEVSLPSAS